MKGRATQLSAPSPEPGGAALPTDRMRRHWALRRTTVLVAGGLMLTVAGVVISMVAVADADRPAAVPGLLAVDFLAFAVVGAVIALARPDNLVGWLMLSGGMLAGLGGAAIDLALLGLVDRPGSVP
ncbi:MAG TPA: hypothetical protein VIC62_09120, partial [Nakamurella sp.]